MIELILIAIDVFLFALYDWHHLNIKKKYIDSHVIRWTLRLFSIIILSGGNIELFFAMSLFFASSFDKVLNLLRGIDLFYLGNRAYWDKFFNKIKPVYIFSTSFGILASIYLLLNGF